MVRRNRNVTVFQDNGITVSINGSHEMAHGIILVIELSSLPINLFGCLVVRVILKPTFHFVVRLMQRWQEKR